MIVKKRSFFELFLPLVIIDFSGQGAALVNHVISSNTRWLLFFILFIYLLAKGKLLQGFTNELLAIFLIYLSWCALTMIWSEIFFLSCAKASMLILISITMAAAGFEWVRRFQWQDGMNWLFLLTVVVLLTGILGKGLYPAVNHLHEIGGWMGGGYGVTIGGGEFVFDNLNAANYGREKANSQLGIFEETGASGLVCI